ncbi:hypothetical protein [Caulobacter sp. LARHSG274]
MAALDGTPNPVNSDSASVFIPSILNVHIASLVPNNAGVLQINLDTARTGLPACTTATYSFSVNTTTLAGQTLAATLLTAMGSNLPIDVIGTGTCEFANLEAVGIVSLHR